MTEVSLNTILLVVVAISNLLTAVLTTRIHKLTLQTEQNTNSMKDALVAATALASRAEGVTAGREGRE